MSNANDTYRKNNRLYLVIKRLLDVVLSLIGVVFLSPLMLAIALLVKVTSRGPVLFRQERLGKNGEVFLINKFRTMVTGAEKMGTGIRVANNHDSRITKLGSFLRKTSLDELPQFFNVIAGNMSLVGPRPPVTYHPYAYEDYSEFQKCRFQMKPGVTGLAQVKVRNSVPWDERIKWDVKYVGSSSLALDLKILLQTVVKIFRPDSIYLD